MENKEKTTLKHFFSVIKKLINRIYFEDYGWEFVPEASVYTNNPDNIQTPLITYKIGSRKTIEGRTGKKPVWKEEYVDSNDKSSVIIVNAQQFDSVINFGFWGSTYEEAEKTRDEFEDFIWEYLGEFRHEGILDMYFLEQAEDEVVKIKEQFFAKQSLLYGVRNERTIKYKNSRINQIDTEIYGPEGYESIRSSLRLQDK
jgi:hypothetical protein